MKQGILQYLHVVTAIHHLVALADFHLSSSFCRIFFESEQSVLHLNHNNHATRQLRHDREEAENE